VPEAPAPPCEAAALSAAELELLLVELLPQADSRSAVASVGRRNFIDCRISGSYPANRPSSAAAIT
jgi:hypothetical protein